MRRYHGCEPARIDAVAGKRHGLFADTDRLPLKLYETWTMKRHHFERHYSNRTGWLRAAVLGANDGIVSVSSLLVGVAATHVSRSQALIVAVAGLVGGAMSMAAGEFVSVSSQADSERSDLERERRELETDEVAERAELAGIYVQRGIEPGLASRRARQGMEH